MVCINEHIFLFKLLVCLCYKKGLLSVFKNMFAMTVKMNMHLDLSQA